MADNTWATIDSCKAFSGGEICGEKTAFVSFINLPWDDVYCDGLCKFHALNPMRYCEFPMVTIAKFNRTVKTLRSLGVHDGRDMAEAIALCLDSHPDTDAPDRQSPPETDSNIVERTGTPPGSDHHNLSAASGSPPKPTPSPEES